MIHTYALFDLCGILTTFSVYPKAPLSCSQQHVSIIRSTVVSCKFSDVTGAGHLLRADSGKAELMACAKLTNPKGSKTHHPPVSRHGCYAPKWPADHCSDRTKHEQFLVKASFLAKCRCICTARTLAYIPACHLYSRLPKSASQVSISWTSQPSKVIKILRILHSLGINRTAPH